MACESNYIFIADDNAIYHATYDIAENTQAVYYFVCPEESAVTKIELHFNVQKYASVLVYGIASRVSCAIDIRCFLSGNESEARVYLAASLTDAHAVTINTVQHHSVPYATSSVVVKTVLYDDAQFFYNGMITVEKDAHHTSARQENKNIVLTGTARAFSKPQLEVLTNDVQCFHASAIGKLDADALFYMQSRGLSSHQAHHLLLQGFFADVMTHEIQDSLFLGK